MSVKAVARTALPSLVFAASLLDGCASSPPGAASEDVVVDGSRQTDGGGMAPGKGGSDARVRDPSAVRDGSTWVVRPDDAARDAPSTSCGVLRARLRDFGYDHPDFEHVVNGRVIEQMVEPVLGPDRKPVENSSVSTEAGVKAFADWYADGPKNVGFELDITLVEQAKGSFVYDSRAFFPLDGMGFGNQYRDHNFSFTTEIHTHFVYNGGEQFSFAGDDDVWVFINGHLAIDLGGVHARETETVELDARASELGIEVGRDYTMDIFHAERHSGESNFRIETSIDCITPVLVI